MSVRIKGQTRVLVGTTLDAGYGTSGLLTGVLTLLLYDPDNFSEPIATRTLSDREIVILNNAAEYGDNILIGGTGSNATILELNSSLETVNSYSYFDTSEFDSGTSFHSSVLCFNGVIYAVFSHRTNLLFDRQDFVTMQGLGNITSKYESFAYPNSMTGTAISDGNLYVSMGYYGSREVTEQERLEASSSYGIYRVNGVNPDKAVRVIQGNVDSLVGDGNGGLYYIGDSGLCHWDGSSTSVIDTGLSTGSVYNSLSYDPITKTLFCLSANTTNFLTAYPNGDFEQKQILITQGHSGTIAPYIAVLGFSPYSDGSTPKPPSEEETETSDPDAISLPSTVIEPVSPSEIDKDILEKIAQLADPDLTASDMKLLTQEQILPAVDPKKSVYEAIRQDNHEAVYKLNQIKVEEDGYYVFWVNVPKEYQGQPADNFKIYLANMNVFTSGTETSKPAALVFGLLNAVEADALGLKLTTLPEKFLAVAMLQASQPFSVFLGKLILALLAGGCSYGTGTAAAVAAILPVVLLKMKRGKD